MPMDPLRLAEQIYKILQLKDGDEWAISKDRLDENSLLITKIPANRSANSVLVSCEKSMNHDGYRDAR